MDNKELFEKFKMNIAINNFKQESHILQNSQRKREYVMKKRIIAGLCACFILVSGISIAVNFDKVISIFRLGKGVETAIEHGYIAEPNMNAIKSNTKVEDKKNEMVLEDINVDTKINEFLMDDLNIATHFNFEFDSKIKEIVDFNNLNNVELEDLVVTDENKNILFCRNREAFDNYCKNNNLDYNFLEFNEHYYNCGYGNFIETYSNEMGTIDFVYNIFSDTVNFPKSKKLFFEFSTVTLKKKDWLENENSVINIKGSWKMEFDVPKEMYERESIAYKVVSCENPDFHITNASVSNTGFEIGIIISNMPTPEQPKIIEDLWEKFNNGEIEEDEFERKLNEGEEYQKASVEYMKKMNPINTEYWEGITDKEVTYIENEKGERFEHSMRAGRRQDNRFIAGDKYTFYETFELTSYDATDTLKLRVMFYGKPVMIELKKAQN